MSIQVPSPDESQASRAVLMEVLTILGKYLHGMVLIGGWVPEIMFPNQGHIGSFDVDLALDRRKIKQEGYDSIRTRLLNAGYRQVDTHAGVFTKDVPGTNKTITVKLDFVTGQDADGGTVPATEPIQDLSVGCLRGVEIALDHCSTVQLSGALPSGATNTVQVRIVEVGAFVCTKAFALNERMKEKDAYDVYFCLKHYSGGPEALARACRPLLTLSRGREAIEILRSKFATIESIGPVWAGQVAASQGDDAEQVTRDAFERAAAFLEELDKGKGSSETHAT